jgi:hypothetical protein
MKIKYLRLFRQLVLAVSIGGATGTIYAGLIKLAESGDVEPNGTNTFFENGQTPVLSDNGKVAFYTDLRDNGFLQGGGLFLADGQTIRTLARAGQPSPDLNGNFYTFNSQVGLNSTNQVFEAGLNGTLGGGTDNTGLYELNAGGLTLLARAGQTIPGGGPTFRSFSGVAVRINRKGQAAFRAATSTKPAVMCRVSDGVLTQLACQQPPAKPVA